MGIFGEDCERPACDEVQKGMPSSIEEAKAMSQKLASKQKVQCPPRSAELGRSSWKLLHSMAAWYPENPTNDQQTRMKSFMTTLAEFYPCTWCAADFQKNIKDAPVNDAPRAGELTNQPTPPVSRAESRKDLSLWLCEQHNRVNRKLGKPVFECTMDKLDERWRKSSNKSCKSDH
eukprot:scaffold11961_cov122-Cylindrotheca_fusiformis.AAC.4